MQKIAVSFVRDGYIKGSILLPSQIRISSSHTLEKKPHYNLVITSQPIAASDQFSLSQLSRFAYSPTDISITMR